jgi:hypothetical protein
LSSDDEDAQLALVKVGFSDNESLSRMSSLY